jgi:pyruvate formate lyase activating enzyme
MSGSEYRKALLWEPAGDDKVCCKLCAHRCLIADGKRGFCNVRANIEGELFSLNYDKICAAGADPIEKKPLFHFRPGSKIFSISAPGCNFKCVFCQNWHISQQDIARDIDGYGYRPSEIVSAAVSSGCKSIAYTYTEPTIFMELCDDCGRAAKQRGLENVFVSNGYMTPEALELAGDWLDAINVDLKAFTEDYYKELCKAKLEPVKQTIKYIAKKTDIWMEITTLIVPGQNDDEDELKRLAEFIVTEAGADVPWHISRFVPNYKMSDGAATSRQTLYRAYEIGKEAGLGYIYTGNLQGSEYESTYCPGCGKLLIERQGFMVRSNNMKNGCCPQCGQKPAGRW